MLAISSEIYTSNSHYLCTKGLYRNPYPAKIPFKQNYNMHNFFCRISDWLYASYKWWNKNMFKVMGYLCVIYNKKKREFITIYWSKSSWKVSNEERNSKQISTKSPLLKILKCHYYLVYCFDYILVKLKILIRAH